MEPWGRFIDPAGLRITMNDIYDRYEKPLFIVENGLGAPDEPDQNGFVEDGYRIDYLREHIQAMKDAVEIDGWTSWATRAGDRSIWFRSQRARCASATVSFMSTSMTKDTAHVGAARKDRSSGIAR